MSRSFPVTRMRRLRASEGLRRMTRETRLSRDDLVLPLFVDEGAGVRERPERKGRRADGQGGR